MKGILQYIPGFTYLSFAAIARLSIFESMQQCSSSLLRSSATPFRTSSIFQNGNTLSVLDYFIFGYQQCVVGHIIALDTPSPSMYKKSRNTRKHEFCWSTSLIHKSTWHACTVSFQKFSVAESLNFEVSHRKLRVRDLRHCLNLCMTQTQTRQVGKQL